jgi:hypothetical protein
MMANCNGALAAGGMAISLGAMRPVAMLGPAQTLGELIRFAAMGKPERDLCTYTRSPGPNSHNW